MNSDWFRYAFLIGACFLSFGTGARAIDDPNPGQPEADRISALERHIGGRLGVAVFDTATRRRFEYHAANRFPLCSTFKFLAAAAVLEKVDQKAEQLDRRIAYGAGDLLEWAPITREHLAEGGMSLEALSAAAIEYSDNTAGNLLLQAIGGPAELTKYIRTLGDRVTRLDRTEPALNSAIKGDERDTTSPSSMVNNLQTLLVGNSLSAQSRQKLQTWLIANTTGAKRLRAGLPASWRVGDKTGTGENGAMGDIAIVWPPNHAPILIAVYLVDSTAPNAALNNAFAEVARLVVETFQTE